MGAGVESQRPSANCGGDDFVVVGGEVKVTHRNDSWMACVVVLMGRDEY